MPLTRSSKVSREFLSLSSIKRKINSADDSIIVAKKPKRCKTKKPKNRTETNLNNVIITSDHNDDLPHDLLAVTPVENPNIDLVDDTLAMEDEIVDNDGLDIEYDLNDTLDENLNAISNGQTTEYNPIVTDIPPADDDGEDTDVEDLGLDVDYDLDGGCSKVSVSL